MGKNKYPLVRIKSALAEQLVTDPAKLPSAVNAFIDMELAADSCPELTPMQRAKLYDYAKAAKLESINEAIALLIEKGLPQLWWDLKLANGKSTNRL